MSVHARADSISFRLRPAGSQTQGTTGALCLNSDRQPFLLTCGHVVLDPSAHPVKHVDILSQGSRLNEPALVIHSKPRQVAEVTTLDAALLQVSPQCAQRIASENPDLLPNGVRRSTKQSNEPVRLNRSSNVVTGRYVGVIDEVRLELFGNAGTYTLQYGHGYWLDSPCDEGDSGAPVLDAEGNLLGLHCGSVVASDTYNAVFCDIDRICTEYGVRVLQRGEQLLVPVTESTPQAGPSTLVPPAVAVNPEDEAHIVALTIWAEAGLRGKQTMECVASVIFNRLKKYPWFGRSLCNVCRSPNQFPCWNPTNHTAPLMREPSAVNGDPPESVRAYEYARKLADDLRNEKLSASAPAPPVTHYHPDWLQPVPAWAEGRQPVTASGGLIFYSIL
ncbi:MAG: cell wall hydrolase [Candidatus Accumulibacter sp.]|nr:cell wall hydrolase [Accumulibacter sp.]MBN8451683.1 cell wall hydrolase [Accumulibacter sp.]MBO3707662.1 cell wall hydrolase [Candidatus Accumulibacter conexus]